MLSGLITIKGLRSVDITAEVRRAAGGAGAGLAHARKVARALRCTGHAVGMRAAVASGLARRAGGSLCRRSGRVVRASLRTIRRPASPGLLLLDAVSGASRRRDRDGQRGRRATGGAGGGGGASSERALCPSLSVEAYDVVAMAI